MTPLTLLAMLVACRELPPSAAERGPVGRDDTSDPCTLLSWYPDRDDDTFGNGGSPVEGCDQPAGHVADATDCDDTDGGVHPGAVESCDGVDENCDGVADSPSPADAPLWYPDGDDDGFGDGDALQSCDAPVGFADSDGDCDDADADVNPAAAEVCDNGVDDDCDGSAGTCGIEGELDVSVADATILGALAYDGLGGVLESSADLTGDGVPDVLVGSDRDAAWVFSGDVEGTVGVEDALAELTGPTDFGRALGAGGDVDGDGHADVVIGADRDSTTAEDAGAVVVISGPVAGDVETEARGGWWFGSSDGAFAGFDVTIAGDVDGDTLVDVAVAGFLRDGASTVDQVVYLLSGTPGTGGRLLDASARLVLDWENDLCCEVSPQYLAAVGDLDGDGLADLAMGSRADDGNDPNGTAYVHLAPFVGDIELEAADIVLTGEADGDDLGRSVGGGGDVDGDGAPDVLVGAYGAEDGAGAVYVVSGAARGALSAADVGGVIVGGEVGDQVGVAVGHAGDVDGDGTADVVASLISIDRPLSCLVYGPITGAVSIGGDAACIVGATGSVWDFATAVDLDDSSGIDLAFGNFRDDTAASDAGAVYLFRGGGI